MKVIKAGIDAQSSNIAIIVSRFNESINSNLLNGAIDVLKRIGKVQDQNITICWVPGAYEFPLIAKMLSEKNKYQSIIALATIIRGQTPHFEYISQECSSGLSDISIQMKIPIVFGVLITENVEQAIDRSGTKFGNKGRESAMVALEMINLMKNIKEIDTIYN